MTNEQIDREIASLDCESELIGNALVIFCQVVAVVFGVLAVLSVVL